MQMTRFNDGYTCNGGSYSLEFAALSGNAGIAQLVEQLTCNQ